MKRQLWVLSAVLVLFTVMGPALAQSKTSLQFSVSFPFLIGDQTFPAGEYELSFDGRNSHHLEIIQTKTKQKTFVKFITRLSERGESGVVFDSINKVRHLSEVYMSGVDGFQICANDDSHGHEKALARNANR